MARTPEPSLAPVAEAPQRQHKFTDFPGNFAALLCTFAGPMRAGGLPRRRFSGERACCAAISYSIRDRGKELAIRVALGAVEIVWVVCG